jgi:sec-independent protein translocase protein TatC
MSSTEDPKGAGAPGAGGASEAETAIERLMGLFGSGDRGSRTPGPPGSGGGGDDDEDDGMLRMSFMGHLEELRSRLIKCILGVVIAAVGSLCFSDPLWEFVRKPAKVALMNNGYPPDLTMIDPMEGFNIIWFKLPLVCAIFLACPWVIYQIWAFISPGLYKRERRWVVPVVLTAGGLFIAGGLFGYFVAFRFGLTFLLGIGKGQGVIPIITVTHYFDIFVNVILGVGLVFELPLVVFFLILFHICTPRFLVNHSRYAVLIIFTIAAIVTPTPDVFNMCLFAIPMCALFYVGIFAGYLLVLKREHRRFPWTTVLTILAITLLILGFAYYELIIKGGNHFVRHWPFISH